MPEQDGARYFLLSRLLATTHLLLLLLLLFSSHLLLPMLLLFFDRRSHVLGQHLRFIAAGVHHAHRLSGGVVPKRSCTSGYFLLRIFFGTRRGRLYLEKICFSLPPESLFEAGWPEAYLRNS